MSKHILALQRAVGVAADGIVGRFTLSALFRRLGASHAIADELGLAGAVHMRSYGILDNYLRLIHFVAQVGHESGGFKYMQEIASGAAYEGRQDLGNTQVGDGVRYKGRGVIQLTGRANYRNYGRALGMDFERHPDIVATPSIGMLVACKYWDDKGLNALADVGDIQTITRRINGGLNGYDDRLKRLGTLRIWSDA
ncbi:MAG: glycoside hydrolase family 19 protein [Pseudomonadota bacterium]|nr:glycoside hydrolase family 19 protein [Pseudomonadota bacterium]